jgi:hypothetical protein
MAYQQSHLAETDVGALIIQVESHSVANEVLSTRLQTELLVDGLHRLDVKIKVYIMVFDGESDWGEAEQVGRTNLDV